MKRHFIFTAITLAVLLNLSLIGANAQTIGALEGQKAPLFSVQLLSGDQFVLEEMAGKPVLLYFWTTWCPSCTITTPAVASFADSQSDIAVLAINLSEGQDTVEQYLSDKEITMPVAIDNGILAAKYLVRFIPTAVLLDSDGMVIKRQIGMVNEHLLDKWYADVIAND